MKQRAMNRHARRAAEASRRSDLQRVQQAPAGTVPSETLSLFFKGIAMQVEKLEFVGLPKFGGNCVARTLAAYQATRALGVNTAIGFGGLVARVGPDERRDVVAFCGPHNMGCIMPNGHGLFHCWVEYQDWIFDPSVGEWGTLDPVATERWAFGEAGALPPIQWTVSLPKYWLKHASEQRWTPDGTPALGEAWYCPWSGDPEIVMQRVCQVHEAFGQQIAGALAELFNTFCEQRGYPNRQDGQVYPLAFSAAVVRGPKGDAEKI